MDPNPANWVEAHGDYLFSFAMLRTGDKPLAEDLVQETFLSAIRSLPDFRSESSERTWLTSILRNKIIDHYRKKDVLKDVTAYLSDTDGAFHDFFYETDAERWGHWRPTTAPKSWEPLADPAPSDDFEAVLRECLGVLPRKLLAVFAAKYLDEENSEKICKEMNLSPSNYWVILHRAKLLMRECLGRKWFENN